VVAIFLAVAMAATGRAAETLSLDRAAIVTDFDGSSFVQYGVEDLAGYLKESSGNDVPIVASLDGESPVLILVGKTAVRRFFPNAVDNSKLGKEGYVLKSAVKNGKPCVIVAGGTPRGTKLALAALMKAIRVQEKTPFVPATLDVVGKLAFANRGMHLNGWPLAYPYTFRSWREADWRRYLDILAYQGVNVFYLWPFIEIMPTPLSPEDQAYLEECRRVVDYAQQKHGMEVWIMQCTNRVANDRCGATDPRQRPYWRPAQEDLNPANPKHFKAIVESREAMYRIINNADGVCNIDSDPGFCADGTRADYVKVLQACRAMLDRYNIHGKQAKLINWMLWGWGRKEKMQTAGLPDHQRLALQAIKQGLPEPLWLISGQFPEYLPMCRDAGMISKTLYLPYGIIEREPAYPCINVQIGDVRNTFRGPDAQFPGLAGVMGNVQTPLLQFPNLFYFTALMCDSSYLDRSEKDVLLELADHLYPAHRELLADCYGAMNGRNADQIDALAGRLDAAVRSDRLGRSGVFARKLFPDRAIVAKSVVLQLRLHAAQERLLADIATTTPRAECEKRLSEYFDAYLAWDYAHGWHKLWGWREWPLGTFPSDPRFAAACKKLRKSLGDDAGIAASFDRIAITLSARHDAQIVQQGCIAPLKKAVLDAAKQ
jgi:hypothetical protein